MNKKSGKKKQEANDLLFPILLVLCVMPFIIRLAVYDCGYGKYDWYSESGQIEDLYHYFRCYFFEIVIIFTAIALAFYLLLNKEDIRPVKTLASLGIYGVMAVVSTAVSKDVAASFQGNFYQFQPLLTLLGYLVIFFFSYQVLRKGEDYQTIWKGLIVLAILMLVVGVFQIFKVDLLDFAPIQKLVMSEELYQVYGGTMETIFSGNNVYLTLFNPNYAGVFLCMLAAVLGVMGYSESEKKKKVIYLGIFAITLVLMWFTYSRGSLVAFAVAAVVLLILVSKKENGMFKYLLWGIGAIVALFLIIDGCNHFKYIKQWVDKPVEQKLTSMETTEKGITLCYGNRDYLVTIEGEEPVVFDSRGKTVELEKTEDDYCLKNEQTIRMFVTSQGGEKLLYMEADENTFAFTWSEKGYYFVTPNGKVTQIKDVNKIDFHGWESLGSGRVYIWSRTIPLLKKYILVGSGPDTFAEVFPQNDYLGKVYYAQSTVAVIERPHNDYLLQWVQLGGVACVAMIVFYGYLLICGGRYFAGCSLQTIQQRLGLGCYLACISYMVNSFFNDSTLFTTPMFWVFAGITLSICYKNKD